MGSGYLDEDGNFHETTNKERAAKCDVCGTVIEPDEEGRLHNVDHAFINADSLGIEGMTGSAYVCKDCLINGISEEGIDKLKDEVFEEKDGDETVEL